MEGRASEKKAHAVCLPYPAQGHITPMLNVANLLHARGFHVTFVNSEYNHARLVRTRGAAAVAGSRGFRFATIPDGLPAASGDDVTQDIPSLCKSTTETCLGPFRRLLAQLNAAASTGDSDHPPVTCVVSDLIMGFSMDAAKELGLPYVQLWTASAISYLAYYHYRLLIDRGIAPLKDVRQLTDGYLDTPVEDLPGLRNMRLRDFPTLVGKASSVAHENLILWRTGGAPQKRRHKNKLSVAHLIVRHKNKLSVAHLFLGAPQKRVRHRIAS